MWLLVLFLFNLETNGLMVHQTALFPDLNNCHFVARAIARQVEEDGMSFRVVGHRCVLWDSV